MTSYQDRYVAFIDILGFKNLVAKSEEDPQLLERLVSALAELNDYVGLQQAMDQTKNDTSGFFKGMFRISTFSDSVLISTNANSLGLMLLLMIVTLISNKLFEQGILSRGGISRGKMIHTENIAIGAGLIKAYQLECTTAIYPRILIDDSILNDPTINQIDLKKKLRQDFDGLWHLHIFEKSVMELNSIAIDPTKNNIKNNFMEAGRKEVENSIKNSTSLSVKAKSIWLARYFNEYAHEHNLEHISLTSS